MAEKTLEERLKENSREGDLYETLDNGDIRCYACGHRCLIKEGLPGICNVRFNDSGTLKVPHQYVGSLQWDPIEKKPFHHVLPGSSALSFGMMGCDYQCSYCENWITSQALRDAEAGAPIEQVTSEDLIETAMNHGADSIISTYNEPLITSEWAVEVFDHAHREDLLTGYVSNGNGTEEVLNYLEPHVDLYKVDLKSFRASTYRELGGTLENTLETLQRLNNKDFWLEVVTLVVPGFNDSDDELRDIASFLAGLSEDIPWHVTAFHSDYKMNEKENTSPETLLRAADIGRSEGLNFVYAGNLPGKVGDQENSYCPECDELLIERYGHQVFQNRIASGGSCPDCGETIPGIWTTPG